MHNVGVGHAATMISQSYLENTAGILPRRYSRKLLVGAFLIHRGNPLLWYSRLLNKIRGIVEILSGLSVDPILARTSVF